MKRFAHYLSLLTLTTLSCLAHPPIKKITHSCRRPALNSRARPPFNSTYNASLGFNTVCRMNIAPGAVDSTRIAAKTITALNIAPGAISQTQLAPAIQNTLTGASNNQSNALVKRDSNGNFTAGTITANLIGNVTGNITNPDIIGTMNVEGSTNLNSTLFIAGATTMSNHLVLQGGDLSLKCNKGDGGCLIIDGTITTPSTYQNSVTQAANIVFIDTNGNLGTMVSSRRYKENIEDIRNAAAIIDTLRPVSFTYKTDATKKTQYGLIAEEVAQSAPFLVIYNKNNQTETVAYHQITPLLLSAYQQQNQRIKQLEAQVALMQQTLDTIALLLCSR